MGEGVKSRNQNKVDLLGLAVELRELKFRCGGGVGDRDIKLEIELVLEEVVDVPALAVHRFGTNRCHWTCSSGCRRSAPCGFPMKHETYA